MKTRRANFINDDRGQAMTEYVMVTALMVALCAWLYYPDNGFYKTFRERYDLTTLVLQLPGP